MAPKTNCTGGTEQGLLSPLKVRVGHYSLAAFMKTLQWLSVGEQM